MQSINRSTLLHPNGESARMFPVRELGASTSSTCIDKRVHHWYTTVLAFPDHLVNSILETLAPSKGSVFFDPYCGSGTSLVEAQSRGLRAFGVDANPCSVLASRVKTDWTIDALQVRKTIGQFARDAESLEERYDDPILTYLQTSGMIARGWITYAVAVRAVAIKRWIDQAISNKQVKMFFELALINSVVRDLSNVKFGPELYCVPTSDIPLNVEASVIARLDAMVDDVETRDVPQWTARVRLGDSRDGRTVRTAADWSDAPAYVVTSPPYPTEHDYTRNSRLELVFLEAVAGPESLRRIKRTMIRSHSKGVYIDDQDGRLVRDFDPVRRLQKEITRRTSENSSGFEGQYPKVVANYFGGMLRHFHAISRYLPLGSKLAYVVGDVASYKGVFIPTAQLLGEMIDESVDALSVESISVWRSRPAHKGRRPLSERVIVLEQVG